MIFLFVVAAILGSSAIVFILFLMAKWSKYCQQNIDNIYLAFLVYMSGIALALFAVVGSVVKS